MAVLCFSGGAFVLWGMAPAAAAMYVISCVACGWVLIPYIFVTAGIILGTLDVIKLPYACGYIMNEMEYDGAAVCGKYIVLLGLLMLLTKLVLARYRGQDVYLLSKLKLPMAVGIFAANIVTYSGVLTFGVMYGIVEAVAGVCLVDILRPGMNRLCGGLRTVDEKVGAVFSTDGVKHADVNQLIISLTLLSSIVIWLIPSDIYTGLNPALSVSLVLIMYVVHRTGAAYGFGMAACTGGIIALKTGRSEWVAWILLVVLVMLIGRALAGKRKPTTLIFYAVGVMLAMIADGMEIIGLPFAELAAYFANLTAPAVVFACIPGCFLGACIGEPDGAYLQVAAADVSRLAVSRMEDMANTLRRLDYSFASGCESAISLSRVGDLVDEFSGQISRICDVREVTDERLLDKLGALGLDGLKVSVTALDCGRSRFYVSARAAGDGLVLSRQVADVLGKYFEKNLSAGMNSPSLFFDEFRTVVYEEQAMFKGRHYVRRIKKQGSLVSGDNFSVKEYEDGRLVMMISDGMGSGSRASCESCMLLDTMEEMLETGFTPEYSISFANSCLSKKNKGETFTTFDMVIIDMYDGTLSSYKQGASVTYILKHTGDGNDVREITGTSLPIGVLEDAECDMADEKLSDGDAVIMVSDGLVDMDTDEQLAAVMRTLRIGDSKRMVDEIISSVLGRDDTVMRDDVTVMAVVLGEAV